MKIKHINLKKHVKWIFSGIGVFIISILILENKDTKNVSYKQKVQDGNIITHTGKGDIKIEFNKILDDNIDSLDLKICILGVENFYYSRKVQLDFVIINNSNRHLTLTDLSIDVLESQPLEYYSIVTPGALFKPIEYNVELDSSKKIVLITNDRFIYNPNEKDDIRLNIYSKSGWKYRVRIICVVIDIIKEKKRKIFSEDILLEFPKSASE